jgi:uncharacterized membrane protein
MKEATQPPVSELQRTVESLLRTRPDLMDPASLQLFEMLLHSHITVQRSNLDISAQSIRTETIDAKIVAARKFTTFATELSGAVFLVVLTALIFPSAPILLFLVLALIGFFGTRYLAPRLDSIGERKKNRNSRRSA